MSTSPKAISIIKALETIHSTSFEQLCSELVYAGALIPDLKQKPISLTGSNVAENHTVRSPQDAVIRLEEGIWIFEYSREKRWKDKFKREVAKLAEQECQQVTGFVFVTTRNIGEERINCGGKLKLSPEEYIQKKLKRPMIKTYVFGQNDLLRVLRNKEYSDIRREWLNISEDYFQSLESFESNHFKQAQDRHIYLEKFVETSSRKQSISALEEFVVQTGARVLLIHSQGGIGKTRFVLEALKRVRERTKDVDILFNQTKKHVNVDEVIPEISEGQKSVIVLDDAHLIENLMDFAKILLERHHGKFILVTRSTARESVKREVGYPAEEIELTPFESEVAIELLKGNLENPFLDQHLKHLARICEGNPLLVGITTHLINTGAIQWLGDLKTDDLVKNYLKEILSDLRSQVAFDCYQLYLALLFLLKPFSVNDGETRLLIREFVDINKRQEGSLLIELESCGVLERHGDTLWLYPDLLGEYLVETTFFSDTPILSIDETFSNIPTSHIEGVFKTLRELDSDKTIWFLKRWARNLSTDVESQNNDERFDNLRLLEIIAPRVPEETLQIIDYLLKPESEKPPEARENVWSPRPRRHRDVLSQCLSMLENPEFKWQNFDESFEILLTMHFYKPEVEGYSALRKDAFEAVVSVAAYDLNLWYQGYGYSIQTNMFEKARKWKQDDLEMYLPLVLGVCRNLLQTEMRSEYADSEGIEWSRNPVAVTDDLVGLRKDVISMLQLIFDEVPAPKQIEVIHVLNCATEFPELGNFEEDMRTMIRDNAKILVNLYLALMSDDATLGVEVIQEIERQAYHLKTWKAVDIKLIRRLLRALKSHEYYQLYRTLAGDASLFWQEEGKSYNEIQTETTEKIKEIANTITHENLIEWLETLNEIAESFPYTSNYNTSRFRQLLFEIGKSKPIIAQALIDKSLSKDNALKEFAAESIRGIRKSTHPDIAGYYVREWLSGEDQTLLLQIPQTYRGVDDKSVGTGDLEIFETLLNCKVGDEKQRQELDRNIMFDIRWIYKKNPEKTIELICQIVKRGDENSISHHLNQLCWSGGQIDLSQWDLKFLEEICQKLVDVSTLDYSAVYIVAKYGEKVPLAVVPFFERRLEKQKQMACEGIVQYYAIPHFLKELAEMYRGHPQYLEVVNQILPWFQTDDYDYETAAADLILGISPEINDQLRMTLFNLARSDSAQNKLAVMQVLEKYPEDSVTDELYKEIVKHSSNDRELQKDIKSEIIRGGAAKLQRWRKRLKSWYTDDNEFLCEFSQREIKDVESSIEFYERLNAEHEMKRKKGLL